MQLGTDIGVIWKTGSGKIENIVSYFKVGKDKI